MGLLDGLNSGGGLLDFLRQNAMNQQMMGGLQSDQAQYAPMQAPMQAMAQMPQRAQPSPLDTAQWPSGPVGAPSQAAALPPNAQPTQGMLPVQQQSPTFGSESYLDRVAAGGGLVRSLLGGSGRQQQQQQLFEAYKGAGLTPQQAYVAVLNPQLADNLLAGGKAKPPTVLGNGYIWDNGKVTRAYEPEPKPPTTLGEGYIWENGQIRRAYDPAKGITNDTAQREAELIKRGMDPKTPQNQQYILTGKYPREDAQPLTATDKKAILEADEEIQSNKNVITALNQAKKLSPVAHQGWLAGARATLGNNLPDVMVPDRIASPASSEATANYENLVLGQALGQLKSTFGAAPTEGERKILLDLQASVGKPDKVRQEILQRAIELAQRRLDFNQEKANALRGGNYYKAGNKPAESSSLPSGWSVTKN